MGDLLDDDDDVLEELTDALPSLSDGEDDREEVGIEGNEDLAASEIDDGPEEIGLDVETLDAPSDELDLDDEEEGYALDDDKLDIEGELEDAIDEDGWTEGSEGAGSTWEDDTLDDEDEGESDDDGGLEGVEDPSLDDFAEEGETTIDMEGDDLNMEEDLERIELDLG